VTGSASGYVLDHTMIVQMAVKYSHVAISQINTIRHHFRCDFRWRNQWPQQRRRAPWALRRCHLLYRRSLTVALPLSAFHDGPLGFEDDFRW